MNLNQLNILLAEDDLDDCIFFKKVLNQLSLPTILTTVYDGEQLMNYLYANSGNLPDILFLDLGMPRKTGFECLAEIKENEMLKELDIAVMTISEGRSIDFEKSLITTLTEMGVREYIRKSGDFEELKRIIHNVLMRVIEKTPIKESIEFS